MTEDEEEMGTGVILRMKGLEDSEDDVLAIDMMVSVEEVLSVDDCRDSRRKGTLGNR